MSTLKKIYTAYGISILKFLILLGASYTIFEKINQFKSPFPTIELTTISILIAVSCLNWTFEILKWKYIVSTVKNLSFDVAMSQSLAAHTAAIITPNKIGEYGAKASFYSKSLRSKALAFTFFNNSYQMLITSLFGIVGIFLFKKELFEPSVVLILSALAIVILGVLYYLGRNQNILKTLHKISLKTHRSIFSFSLLRYILFSFQYLFILKILGVEYSYIELLPFIWLLYFISSCIPSFALLDFAIKGSVGIFIFSSLGIQNVTILTAAFAMWFFNFALPGIIGGFYIYSYNPKKRLHHDTIK